MEIVQGVTIRVKTEGAGSVDALNAATDKLAKATDALASAADKAAPKLRLVKDEATKLEQATHAVATQGLGPLSGSLARISGLVIPAGLIAGFGMLTKSAIDSADAMQDMAKRTGFSTETLSALGYGAKQADTNLEAVALGVRNMSRAVEMAARGNGELQDTFKRLGVSLNDLRHLNSEQLFQKLVNGLMAVKDPTERLALGQQVLGRSSQELMSYLHDLAGDGFQRVKEEAQKAGVVIGTDTAAAADQFNDSLEKLKANAKATGLTLASALLPALQGTIDVMNSDSWTRFLNPLALIREAIRGIVGAAMLAGQFLGQWLVKIEELSKIDTSSWAGIKRAATFARGMYGDLTNPDNYTDVEKQLSRMFPNAAGADVLRAPGSGPADRNVTPARNKAAEEAERARERELAQLEAIRQKHAEVLATTSAQGEVEKQIARIYAERDKEVDRIARMTHLTTQERYQAEIDSAQAADQAVTNIHATQLQKFNADMAKFGRELTAKIYSDEAEEFAKNVEDMHQQGLELLAAMKQAAEGAAVQFVGEAHRGLSSALADVATTGGKNLGQIAGQTFSALVEVGAQKAADALFKAAAGLGGDKITQTADGKYIINGDASHRYDTMQDAAGHTSGGKALGMGLGVASIGLQGYTAGQSGAGGRTQATLGGAMAGAGMGATYGSAAGPWGIVIGAVIGAIAGAIGGALGAAQRRSEYQYAVPIWNGSSYELQGDRNLTPEKKRQMTEQLNDTFTNTWNQWVNVMLKLPGSTMPKIGQIRNPYTPDYIQDNPSAHFMEHFQEYLTERLPREVADMFKKGMEGAFVKSGMTSEAFEKFWQEADKLDPTKRAQFWSDLADGMTAWGNALRNMDAVKAAMAPSSETNPFTLTTGGPYKFSGGELVQSGQSDFSSSVKQAASGLYDVARQMVNLTGPDRVAAFKALGQGVENLTLNLQQFIQQVGETIARIHQSFKDDRLQKELERAPDDEARKKILYREYQGIQDQLNNATALGLSPQQIEELTNRGRGLLDQIYKLDPSDAMYEWWKRNSAALETLSVNAANAVAKQAQDEVQSILDTLKPFYDWFVGLPVDLDPAWTALDTSINGAAAALNDLAATIHKVTNPTTPGGGGTGGGGGGGKGGGNGGGGDDNNAARTVVHVNGPVYGVQDLQRQIIAAVRRAQQSNPAAFDASY